MDSTSRHHLSIEENEGTGGPGEGDTGWQSGDAPPDPNITPQIRAEFTSQITLKSFDVLEHRGLVCRHSYVSV